MLLRSSSLIVLFLGMLVTGFAHAAPPAGEPSAATAADRERSRAAFRRGVARVKAGDYAGARDAFEEAHRLFPHPSILLNLGLARTKTGEYAMAEQNLSTFLVDDGGAAPEEQKSARAALAEVRAHLGTLRVQVVPDGARATLDGKALRLVPGTLSELRVVAGEHALAVSAEGYEPSDETIRVVAGKDTTKKVTLVAEAADPLPPPPPLPVTKNVSAGRKDREREGEREREQSPDESSVKAVGWGLVGLGAVSFGFATYAGLRALSLSNEYERTGSSESKSTGITLRSLADVSLLVGLASTGIGVYLLLSAPRSPAAPGTARLVVAPGHASVVGWF